MVLYTCGVKTKGPSITHPEVPILVLDSGEVVSGSGAIARWANEDPRSPAKSGG